MLREGDIFDLTRLVKSSKKNTGKQDLYFRFFAYTSNKQEHLEGVFSDVTCQITKSEFAAIADFLTKRLESQENA